MRVGRILGCVLVLVLTPAAQVFGGATPSLTGRVVYTSDGSLFVSSADGKHGWRLTRSAGDTDPAWSPDGTKVAFVRITEHGTDLHVIGGNGQGELQLASDVDLAFSWSPDGTKIAYSSATRAAPIAPLETEKPHIHVVDVVSGVSEQLTRGDRADVQPVWSPDGDHIVFAGSPDEPVPTAKQADADLYRLTIATGRLTQLTDAPGSDFDAHFSPNGRLLTFASSRDAKPGSDGVAAPEIYTMTARGTRETRVSSRLRAHDVGPVWSGNGDRIAYVSYSGESEEGEGEIRVADLKRGTDRALTDRDEMMAWSPAWGPNNIWVVFVSSVLNEDGSGSDTEITFVPTHGGEPRFVTRGPRFEWGPDWT